MFIINPHTSRPPLGTLIDQSNSLSRGLIAALPFNEGGGTSLEGASLIGSSITWNNGIYIPSTASTNDRVEFTNLPALGDEYSILIGIDDLGITPGISGNMASRMGSGTCEVGFRLVSSVLKFSVSTTSSFNAPTYRGEGYTTLAATMQSGTLRLFKNGVLESQQLATPTASETYPFRMGSDNNNRRLYGRYYFLYIYDRGLKDAEVREICSNPWALYQPQRLWLPFSQYTGPYILDASPVSFVTTGNSVGLNKGRLLVANASILAINGNSVVIKILNPKLSASPTIFNVNGFDARFLPARILVDSANLTFKVDNAALNYSAADVKNTLSLLARDKLFTLIARDNVFTLIARNNQ